MIHKWLVGRGGVGGVWGGGGEKKKQQQQQQQPGISNENVPQFYYWNTAT
jgi:hypothetical protein